MFGFIQQVVVFWSVVLNCDMVVKLFLGGHGDGMVLMDLNLSCNLLSGLLPSWCFSMVLSVYLQVFQLSRNASTVFALTFGDIGMAPTN